MIFVNTILSQQFAPAALPTAVRAALGKPLRRAAGLTQLALVGALACLPKARRQLPSALLWQSTSGPRLETLTLLNEVCCGPAEPMPYDFLATQPAIAAAQIQPFFPGLQSASYFPLDTEGQANWLLLLTLAANWIEAGRYAQVLCAHLDSRAESASGHWLVLAAAPLENTTANLHIRTMNYPDARPDTPDFPLHLADWLATAARPVLHLQSSAAPLLAVEFARI